MTLAAALVTELADALATDPGLAEQLADALAPYLPDRGAEPTGWLTAQRAADYLGVTRKRIHDLTSARSLIPDGRDGRTPLYTRQTLDAYARAHAS